MADVIGIEKCDQNIDVEQRSHSVGVLFTQSINLLISDQATATFKRHEAAHSSTSGFRRSTGECPAGQLRQHSTCCSIRLPREALGCLQYVVVDVQCGTHGGILRIRCSGIKCGC